jgi:hypothetical protein
MPQSMSEFLAAYDKVTLVQQSDYTNTLVKQGKFLSIFGKPIGLDQDGKPFNGLPTMPGRRKMLNINADYTTTTANVGDYATHHTAQISATMSKNLIQPVFTAVDKGYAIQITTNDLQNIQGQPGSKASNITDFVKKHQQGRAKGMAVSIEYSMLNGTGSITKSDGSVEDDFYGIPSIVGSGSLGGYDYTSWSEWQGHTFDMAGNLFGMTAASSWDTLAHLTTVATGETTTPFYRLIMTIVKRMLNYIPGTTINDIAIFMHPHIFDGCLLPSVEACNKAIGANILDKNQKDFAQYPMADFNFAGVPIFEMDSMLPSTATGGTPTFIAPAGHVYFINKKELHLKANDMLNFKTYDWERVPGIVETYQRQVQSTLLFYPDSRCGFADLVLPTAFNTTLAANYGTY